MKPLNEMTFSELKKAFNDHLMNNEQVHQRPNVGWVDVTRQCFDAGMQLLFHMKRTENKVLTEADVKHAFSLNTMIQVCQNQRRERLPKEVSAAMLRYFSMLPRFHLDKGTAQSDVCLDVHGVSLMPIVRFMRDLSTLNSNIPNQQRKNTHAR